MKYRLSFIIISILLFTSVTAAQPAKAGKAAKAKTNHIVRDITELMDNGKIEVETSGEDIQTVNVRLKNLTDSLITAVIPVGTFFVSERTSSQNMVVTEERRVQLKKNRWVTISVSAACANRPKNIPGGSDRFSVKDSPYQEELKMLVEVLKNSKAGYAVRQAAVWIVTDDASYADLGILERGYYGMGGSRVINETEAAEAMRLCSKAGVNVTLKEIWKDKNKIASELSKSSRESFIKWCNSL